MQPTILGQIRKAREHLETGDIEAAKDLIREILASIDRQVSADTSPQWPRPVLQFVRLRLLKAGRAVVKSDFDLAVMALDEASRALKRPAEESA